MRRNNIFLKHNPKRKRNSKFTRTTSTGSISDDESVDNEVVNDGSVNGENNMSIENSKRYYFTQTNEEGIVEAE